MTYLIHVSKAPGLCVISTPVPKVKWSPLRVRKTEATSATTTQTSGEAARSEVENRKEVRTGEWEKLRVTCEVLLRYKHYGFQGTFFPLTVSCQEPHPHTAKAPFQWSGKKEKCSIVTCKRDRLHSASGTCFTTYPVQSRGVSPSTSFSSAYPPSHCIKFTIYWWTETFCSCLWLADKLGFAMHLWLYITH